MGTAHSPQVKTLLSLRSPENKDSHALSFMRATAVWQSLPKHGVPESNPWERYYPLIRRF